MPLETVESENKIERRKDRNKLFSLLDSFEMKSKYCDILNFRGIGYWISFMVFINRFVKTLFS